MGVRVMLDLASWETLREHAGTIRDILVEGLVECCICNEVIRTLTASSHGFLWL